MTVLDTLGRPVRDLRISVTDRCNFRCVYCMPKEVFGHEYRFLPRRELLTFEEIERVARVFVDLGVQKLRITGGEPLLRRDLELLIARLAALGDDLDVTLTTNAALLAQKATALADAGLSRITVSLDSLDDEVFRAMNDVDFPVARVLAGIDAAAEAGLPVKVNVVVKRGLNEASILDIARRFRGTGHSVRFIEFMDVGATNGWRLDDVVPAAEIVATIGAEFPLEPVEAAYRGEVAERYRYRDGAGEIGVIASVTQPFCGDCTRARISADGKLYTCLFAVRGHDLRALLRSDSADELDDDDPRRVDATRRSLLGDPHRGHVGIAEGRDVVHRRLATRPARSLEDAHPEGGPTWPTRSLVRIVRSCRASSPRHPGACHAAGRIWPSSSLSGLGSTSAYQIARGAADRSVADAFHNGEWVLRQERELGALFEPAVQRVVDTSSIMVTLTSYTYWLSQFAVVGADAALGLLQASREVRRLPELAHRREPRRASSATSSCRPRRRGCSPSGDSSTRSASSRRSTTTAA